MVDENDTNAATENMDVEQPATTSKPKKQRAKRRTPAELAAVAAAKLQKANAKKQGASVEAGKPTTAGKSTASKPAARGASTTGGAAKAEPRQATSAPIDEFADLLKLEEENKALRKALSEKLRAENADLRKRLGQA